MKKLKWVLASLWTLQSLTAAAGTPLKVGAALAPHADILEFVRPELKKQGIDLEIKILDDEGQLNPALAEKQIDANFFQHVPYLDNISREKGYKFKAIAKVHVEPIGFYSSKIKTLADLKDGAKIGIPNNPSNEYRSLVLLQKQGLIKLKAGINPNQASPRDIAENPRHIKIVEIDAPQIPRSLPDLDGAIINTNVVLESKLDPASALFREDASSPYANVLVVRQGDEARPALEALRKSLQSSDLRAYITKKYGVAVVPAF